MITPKEAEPFSGLAAKPQSDQECLAQNGSARIVHVQIPGGHGAYFIYNGANMLAFTDAQWAQFRGLVNSA
jgi:hypothetical protein